MPSPDVYKALPPLPPKAAGAPRRLPPPLQMPALAAIPSDASVDTPAAPPVSAGTAAATERRLVRTAATMLAKNARALLAAPDPAADPLTAVVSVQGRVTATLRALLEAPAPPAGTNSAAQVPRERLRRAVQLAALLHASALLCATPSTIVAVAALPAYLDTLASATDTQLGDPPSALTTAPANSTGRVRGTEALARTAAVWHMLRTAWRDASDKGITSALATTTLDVWRASPTVSATGSLDSLPHEHRPLLTAAAPAATVVAPAPAPPRKSSKAARAKAAATEDDDLFELLARQGERQMNDQRTAAPRPARSVTPDDLAPLLAAIERMSAARMDGQRAPAPAELRERRLHELEVYVERQQQQSLDNQRVGLTEAKERAMDAEALAGWVVQLHKMRYEDQTAPSPATRRREMLDAVAVVVERMQTLALDDQTFVGAMAEHLELSPRTLRVAMANRQSDEDAAAGVGA